MIRYGGHAGEEGRFTNLVSRFNRPDIKAAAACYWVQANTRKNLLDLKSFVLRLKVENVIRFTWIDITTDYY